MDEWGIVGHEWAVRLLRQAIAQGELSHAYLFTGPSSVGKTTLANALASALLCLGERNRPCGECRACRLAASGGHPDLHHLRPASKMGRLKVAQVRELEQILLLTPNLSPYRVAVLERFERATPSAANALLKTLEEPPSHVVLILLAPDTDSLLPTIVSRCQVIPLRPLPAAQVEAALEENWGVPSEQARRLAHLSGGRIGWAIRAARNPAIIREQEQRLEELDGLLKAPLAERFRYAATMSLDVPAAEEVLELWAGWWRDVMLYSSGIEEGLTHIDEQERLAAHAARLNTRSAARLAQATRTTADHLRRNANPRLALEVLLAFDLPRW